MKKEYDYIIIGAGSAGLSAVDFVTKLGGIKSLVVEKDKIGGDCTWTGCIPSKALLHVAHTVYESKKGQTANFIRGNIDVDFQAVKSYVKDKIKIIAETESPEVLQKKGSDVVLGKATFITPHEIEVEGTRYQGKKFLICTGAKLIIPPIEGIDQIPYYTYENIFDIEILPEHLIVIGGGPVGCELAQAFSRLGSRVTIIEGLARLLSKDDIEASEAIEKQFNEEEIEIVTNEFVSVVQQTNDLIQVTTQSNQTFTGTHLLIAAGRIPNTTDLGLENTSMELNEHRGIKINKNLQTSEKHIYAAGDCLGGAQFTHIAGYQGFVAARNALLPGNTLGIPKCIPWATFTQPEVAHTGITSPKDYDEPDRIMTCRWPLSKVDRAITDSNTTGFIKVYHLKTGKILGVSIVSPVAGEMINEWIVAMNQGIKIGELSSSIHVYPTYSLAHMQVGAAIRLNKFLNSKIGKIVTGVSRFFR